MPTEALNKAWILTFTDLVYLLLTFFVMLFAMATPPVLTTGPEISLVQGLPTARTATLTQSFPKRSVNLDYLYHVLLDQPIEIEKARLHLDSDKLVLSLPMDIFADTTELTPAPDQTEKIHALGYLLNNLSNKIAIRTTANVSDTQQAIGVSAQIANLLKQGGYIDSIPVYAYMNAADAPRIDILIYPYAKENAL